MVVLLVESVSTSLRGQLSKWMLEPKAGVFVGRISAAVRELLWEKACREIDEGGVTLIYRTNNEQGYSIRSYGDTTRRVEDWEGLLLVRRPNEKKSEGDTEDSRRDWSEMLHVSIWAKTPRFVQLAPNEPDWHPLVCHLIDVAMVGRHLWDHLTPRIVKKQVQETLGLENEREAGKWVAFFIGLHDIGKATPGFALKWEDGRERLLDAGYRPQGRRRGFARRSSVPHGYLSSSLLANLLQRQGIELPDAVAIGFSLGGHHGTFPDAHARMEARDHLGGSKWKTAQEDLFSVLAHVTGVDEAPPPISGFANDQAFLIWLAGITSVADWIGSNHDYFKFQGEDVSLAEYTRKSDKIALEALKALGWFHRTEDVELRTFHDVTGYTPNNDLQRQVESMRGELSGPAIALIEYPMGGGKTEAAFYLSHLMHVSGGQHGLYMAMPSMATSNQMFTRTIEYLQNSFPGETINVQLLHARADLNPHYAELIERGLEQQRSLAIDGNDRDVPDQQAHLLAAEWFTHRKQGLLAQNGIGTIDQALLGVLNTKHYFVRLYGLSGKVVVFDEVHALDPYMQSLFSKLLTWLAACGSSVILLSATLSERARKTLLSAYLKGRGRQDLQLPDAPQYPRITWMSDKGTGSIALQGPKTKTVYLRAFSPDVGEDAETASWIDELDQRLSAGGCAAVLCNTVGRAQEMYQELLSRFKPEELILFHARFPIDDRMRLEETVLRFFGKDGAERPHRMVCVATQVIEQSLDLDFDLMVTELAPIELIMQRSGRVWRHDRPERDKVFKRSELWILFPSLSGDGVPQFHTSDIFIYGAHPLLRSYLRLRNETMLRIPKDVDELMNSVYSEQEPPPSLSPPLANYWRETALELERAEDDAKKKAVDREIPSVDSDLLDQFERLFDEDSEEIHEAHQAMTRLGGLSVEVVCLYRHDNVVTLDAAGKRPITVDRKPNLDEIRQLIGRSLRLSFHPGIVRKILDNPPPDVWDITSHLRRHRPLWFSPDGDSLDDLPLRLDSELGLVYVSKKEEDG